MTVGKKVGRYLIRDNIGVGGMATVYRGEHELLGHEVAIKVLHPHHVHDQNMDKRFLNEARAIAALDHPGIVQLFDIGRLDDGRAYVIMELLRGETLRKRIARSKLQVNQCVVFARQIASAMGAAHDAGIVHRDLKPENVFIVADHDVAGGLRTKVLDFGIAKRFEGGNRLTRTGILLGTPRYMAPEQSIEQTAVDARFDVYSLGVLMFEMLSGELPYEGEITEEFLAQKLTCAPRSLRSLASDIPDSLNAVVMRCLEIRPDARFASMKEIARALEGVEREVSSERPREQGVWDWPGDDSELRTNLWAGSLAKVGLVARGRRLLALEHLSNRDARRQRLVWGISILVLLIALIMSAGDSPEMGAGGPMAPMASPADGDAARAGKAARRRARRERWRAKRRGRR